METETGGPDALLSEQPKPVHWHGNVAIATCPYCYEWHYVTSDRSMFEEATEAGKMIKMLAPFTITVPMELSTDSGKVFFAPKLSTGDVWVVKCPRCGRTYILHMRLRNADKHARYRDQVKFSPGMEKPKMQFEYTTSTVSDFLSTTALIPNAFTKANMPGLTEDAFLLGLLATGEGVVF